MNQAEHERQLNIDEIAETVKQFEDNSEDLIVTEPKIKPIEEKEAKVQL